VQRARKDSGTLHLDQRIIENGHIGVASITLG
jgi:hypothetical protein